MVKIVKGTPSQKRRIPPTLAAFQSSNAHIDLIAFVYETITEEKAETFVCNEEWEILGDELYTLISTIKTQLGVEKYIEVVLFISMLKRKYVTDLRKNKIAEKETLVFFDNQGKVIVKSSFNCMLILQEIQNFIPNKKVLKHILETNKITK